MARYGPVDALDAIRAGLAPAPVLALAGGRRGDDRADQDLATAQRHGIRLVTPEDDEWPAFVLQAMEIAISRGVPDLAPPLALWAKGPLPIEASVVQAVSVVGSRACTAYGEHVAAELGFGLADHGWTVISGGALGIDGAGHRGALSAGGTTVAILAGGLDRPYPAAHGAMFERIAETGLLLSEWPPGCAPYRQRFLIRNRLIAGLAAGTVVVEAAVRSGASSTARRCRQLDRPVMAVPGPVTSALSVGTHELLRGREDEQARLVCTTAHVLEEVGRIGADLTERPRGAATPRDGLDALPRQVLDGVPARRAASPERIAVSAGVAVLDVLRVLPALEVMALVECTSMGWRLAPSERSGSSDRSGSSEGTRQAGGRGDG